MVSVAMLNHAWWVLGAALGAAIGARAQVTIPGIDFSLAALFAVLAVEQWRATRNATSLAVAVVSYVAAALVVPAQALAVSITACAMAGIALRKFKVRGAL